MGCYRCCLGISVAGVVSGSISFIVAQHHYKIDWEYKKIGSMFFLFFGSALIIILVRYFGIHYCIRGVIKLFLLSSYLVLGMVLNIITKQNFNLVKSIIIPVSIKKDSSELDKL